jgi:hypothetical protein
MALRDLHRGWRLEGALVTGGPTRRCSRRPPGATLPEDRS